MTFSQNRSREGFTLIEIMIAIVIVGILAAVAIPAVMNQLEKAKVKTAKLELRNYKNQIEMYYADTNEYPNTLNDLVVCPKGLELKWLGGAAPKAGQGGYVKNIKADPWGRPYIYSKQEYHGEPYTLYSKGSDPKDAKRYLYAADLDK